MKKYWLVSDIVSASILLLLLYTGIDKINRHNDFMLALASAPLLKHYAVPLSWAIPVIELLIAWLLFFTATRLKGLYAAWLLITVFTVYLAWMLLHTNNLPCSCGGFIEKLSWQQHVFFNGVLIVLISTGIVLNKRKATKKERPPT